VTGDDWGQYRELVLSEFRRIDERITRDLAIHVQNDERLQEDLNQTLKEIRDELRLVQEKQSEIREDIATLKVKSGLIGGMAGAIASFAGHFWK
jgi:hypothetical protein